MKKFINSLSIAPNSLGPQNRQNVAATIIAIASIFMLIYLISQSGSLGKISDLPEYYVPSKMIVDGRGADGYILAKLGQEQHNLFGGMDTRVVALFVPPQGLALISPIGILNVAMIAIAWKTFLVGCLIAAIIFLKLSFSLNYKQTAYSLAAICISYPCFEALRIDQLAPILLLSFSATIYFLQKNKDLSAGLWLAPLILLKPQQILPFLVYLCGLRRWRALAVLVGTFILFTVIAYFQIGISGFQNYFALVRSPESINYMQPELNPTLRGQLMRLLPSHVSSIMVVSIIVYAAVLAFSFLYGQKNLAQPKAVLKGVLCLMPIGLVASLHCHDYDLLLLIPSITIIFTNSVLPSNRLSKLMLMLASIPFMLPVAIFIHYFYLLPGGKINLSFLELAALSLLIIYKVLYVSRKIDTTAAPK